MVHGYKGLTREGEPRYCLPKEHRDSLRPFSEMYWNKEKPFILSWALRKSTHITTADENW